MSNDLILAKIETLTAKVDSLVLTGTDNREKMLEIMRQTSEMKTAVEAIVASGGNTRSEGSSGDSVPALKSMLVKCLFPDSLDVTFSNGTPSDDERKELYALMKKTLPAAMMDLAKPLFTEAMALKNNKNSYKLHIDNAVEKLLTGRSKNVDAYKALNNDARFLEIYNKYFKAKGKTAAKNPTPPLNSKTMDKMIESTAGASWIEDDSAPAATPATPAATVAQSTIVPATTSSDLWE